MKNSFNAILATLMAGLLLAACSPKTLPPKDRAPVQTSLRILSPTPNCPQEGPPIFSWTPVLPEVRQAAYALRLVELREKQDASAALRSNEPILNQQDIKETSLKFPERLPALRPGAVYAFQVSAYDASASPPKPVGQSDIGLFFMPSSSLPFSLEALLCCDQNLLSETLSAWAAAYGAPAVNPKQGGCFQSAGVVEMKGNRQGGDAIRQQLGAAQKIARGKRYQFSFCARAYPKQLGYVRFRVLAFNGSLPVTGAHPQAGADIAVIGESANILSTEWNRYFFSSWQAPEDYANIAILAIASDDAPEGGLAHGALSGICLEITEDWAGRRRRGTS